MVKTTNEVRVVIIWNISQNLDTTKSIRIELGCGTNKRKNYIGIDQLNLPGVDIVGDAVDVLKSLPSESIQEIYSKSFLEHIENLEIIMHEIQRVLKPGGLKILFVPHFSNPYYYSDYTHKSPIGYYTFDYFCVPDSRLRRHVPTFYNDIKLKTKKRKFIFSSKFKLMNYFKKFLQLFVNSSIYTQEFYEENLCFIFPCYGLEVELEKI